MDNMDNTKLGAVNSNSKEFWSPNIYNALRQTCESNYQGQDLADVIELKYTVSEDEGYLCAGRENKTIEDLTELRAYESLIFTITWKQIRACVFAWSKW